MCAMLPSVHFLGGTLFLDAAFSAGSPKRVPAHGMEDVVSAHPHMARQGIADGVIAHVSHMQRAGRIRQHFQHVEFLALAVIAAQRRKGLRGLPPVCHFSLCSADRSGARAARVGWRLCWLFLPLLLMLSSVHRRTFHRRAGNLDQRFQISLCSANHLAVQSIGVSQ